MDGALRKLGEFDKRISQAIELMFFGGMTTEEIGTILGISVATVGREIRFRQAWLRREFIAGFGMRLGAKIDRWNLIQEFFRVRSNGHRQNETSTWASVCGDDEELRSEVASTGERQQ
jgi:hypothetical protein